MFSNLSYQDKQAFFSLLDEYFESRPHLRPGAAGDTASTTSAPPPVSLSSRPPGRPTAPPAPVRTPSATASHTAPSPPSTRSSSVSEGTGAHTRPKGPGGSLGQAKGAFNESMYKVTSNSTVKSTLGKVGAGGIASKFTPGSTFKATGNVPGPGERHLPPPPSRSGGSGTPVSAGKYGAGAAAGGYAEEKTPLPAYNGAGRAQAVYDFDGGDATDLPLQAGEVVTIIAKTSADWWTCQNASGKQGLVPANYMTEL